MRVGRMKHRVQFEEATISIGDFGDTITTYTPIGTKWAQVQPISGKERLSANALQSEVTHRIWCRYDARLNATNRARFGCGWYRVLDILSVRNVDEANQLCEMLAVEYRVHNPTVLT